MGKYPMDVSRFVYVAAAAFLAGCATAVEGARTPPESWISSGLHRCEDLSGIYTSAGEPAPANAHPYLYNVVWPIKGSLVSLIELGANGPIRKDAPTVRISFNSPGQASFSAFRADGVELALSPRDWWCQAGALVTRTPIDVTQNTYGMQTFEEVYLRLVKGEQGSLIAEHDIRTVKPGTLGASPVHRTVARFYFRFPAAKSFD
jgi:hypothetical protein